MKTKTGSRIGRTAHVVSPTEAGQFTGIVTRVDDDNYLIFVRDESSGETWGVPQCEAFVS